MPTPPDRLTLRALPLSARLVLAVFLVAVGLGYGSALVQLHFQHASPGQLMPTAADVIRRFHGDPDPAKRVSTLQRLLEADESQPFNGSGSMAAAFTKRSDGWTKEIRKHPEAEVRREREGERQAVLWWLKDGLRHDAYEADRLPLPASLAGQPVTAEFRNDDGSVKIKSLFTARCVRCHQKDGDDPNAANYPLDKPDEVQTYAKADPAPGTMSVSKLAQTTHAHLLSFAVLFALTGLVIAFSSYPGWLRGVLAPAVLVAQVVDVSCWWLARLDGPTGELFAQTIMVTGGVVGAGLFLQIVLGLFDLFGGTGKVVLLLLFIGAGVGAAALKQQVIDPQIQAERREKAAAVAPAAPEKPAENGAP
jgi:cytochrome c553